MRNLRASTLAITLLTLLCCGLLYTNVKLAKVARQLEARESSINSGAGPVVGSKITRIGDRSTLITSSSGKEPRRGSLVLVFSPDCRYCKQNVPNWNQFVMTHAGLNIFLADLTSDPKKRGLPGLSLRPDAVMLPLKPEEQILYNFHVTPTTVILDRNGIVKGSWPGLLSPADLEQMEISVRSIQG